ncbi:helix-turn-helix domain protein [Ruminiclostridium papyrosolvens DSM 2782]|uniref:Helix-turn-helix domain protein n=2 Tax=Ruminiclostridium papyrosolvens TaxID=29362 RepID=F1TE95_9FIRM|nr:helix-turn-helix domain-containing protein [Ruminiclostridium papyrosolvens]EGD47061.1 helix-turn-helix domain protein [Ruminiclostridium papyrosolvens DSM 2782]WES36002.1 helix-turn-helix domain-containing protein [Ruminiclostridium papyrosolvens DSM 2782]WES36100.1 helix-turn-helix domain-containing protein [Ruminiclostridium papyrosolvens DSM 2782]
MFSRRLALLMEKFNLKPADLANELGVTPSAISKLLAEEGRYPSIENLKKLRRIFNVSIDYLLGCDIEDINDMLNTVDVTYIASAIKELRRTMNLSQKEFALYNDLKVKEIKDIEDGKSVDINTINQIANLSGVSIYKLLGQNQPYSEDNTEKNKLIKFAANLDNREFMNIAIRIKNSGIPLDNIIIARKL